MGGLGVGEFVLGIDGRPTQILAVSEIMHDRPCYQIEFISGDVITADSAHQWLVRAWLPDSGNNGVPPRRRLLTTREIYAGLQSRAGTTRYYIDSIAGVDLGIHANAPKTFVIQIVSIKQVCSVPVRCIKVAAADGMFLCGRAFIPTHNSDALLMSALQFADVPGYAALLLRRSYADLSLPGAIMDRAHAWLGGTAAKWNDREKTWRFPGGGSITFGYLENKHDHFRYQGAEFQTICFDELTQFDLGQYEYLLSRLRRLATSSIPLRMRSASNPGGRGHQWVYSRFDFPGKAKQGRPFVPARLADNPHLDAASYRESLAPLNPTLRAQLEEGQWITDPRLKVFDLTWWRGRSRYDISTGEWRRKCVGRWISWDTASTDNPDSAHTAGTVWELSPEYTVGIAHAVAVKAKAIDVPGIIVRHAERWNADGKLKGIIIENKDSGIMAIQSLSARGDWISRKVIAFDPGKWGNKIARANLLASWCENGSILLPYPDAAADWLYMVEEHLAQYPDTEFADLIDSLSQGGIYLANLLARGYEKRVRVGA